MARLIKFLVDPHEPPDQHVTAASSFLLPSVTKPSSRRTDVIPRARSLDIRYQHGGPQ